MERAHQPIVALDEAVHFVQGTGAHGTGPTGGRPQFGDHRSGAVGSGLTLGGGGATGGRPFLVILFRGALIGEAAVRLACDTESLVRADFFRAYGTLHFGVLILAHRRTFGRRLGNLGSVTALGARRTREHIPWGKIGR